MSTLRFNDGVSITTSGRLRVIKERDGYYVVGDGMCIPVDSWSEGMYIIEKAQSKKEA